MATATVTDFVTRTVNATAAATSSASADRATPQGGVFEGVNPTVYDPKNPIILFVIQAAFVIILTRIIHFPLAKLRQPRVIAEVITGIVLGPSIMGRIPNFTNTIFPTQSMAAFTLAANLGLVLFLFLVGLEVDLRFLVSNWRIAVSVGALGMIFPFGLGCAIAWGLFHEFRSDPGLAPISFPVYMLFIGVALAITVSHFWSTTNTINTNFRQAFPVLCRILTTLKLLGTPVGVIVLSAGVANDVVGWILLALCVALVNSGAGLTALYILLVAVGYTLFLVFAVRPALMYLLRKTGSLANGPTQTVVAIVILLVLASSFFTGVIGIHPIFGAFMMGLLLPHEGGFAVKLTEKIEDLVSVLFLPLYFALSGLSTNLGLLNNGLTWAYVVGVCAIAFVGKIAGGTLASRLNGLVWRESFTIGCLMSCKGLVELIVLNIGLQAKILSTRTFTIFVVMALITTFATTPLTTWLYPPWYQQKLELWKKGKIDWDGNPIQEDGSDAGESDESLDNRDVVHKLLVYLRLDGLPSILTFLSLIGRKQEEPNQVDLKGEELGGLLKNLPASNSVTTLSRPLRVQGLRLMELTERESSVMKVSEIEEFASRDPIIKAFGTFGQSFDVAVGGQIAVVPEHSFSGTLMNRAQELRSDFILIPWSETGTMSEYPSLFDPAPGDPLANREFANLVSETFDKAFNSSNIGVFIDKTVLSKDNDIAESPTLERSHHGLNRRQTGISIAPHSAVQFKVSQGSRHRLLVLYQGGADDLFAVKLGLQLARHDSVDLRILRVSQGKEVVSDTETEAGTEHFNFEFDHIRTSVPATMARRVRFDDVNISAGLLESISGVLSEPNATETLVILGRGSGSDLSMSHISSASSSHSESKVIGTLPTQVLNLLRNRAGASISTTTAVTAPAGLLVVQAKRKLNDDPGPSTAPITPVATAVRQRKTPTTDIQSPEIR